MASGSRRGGLGWFILIALVVAIGVAVFFLWPKLEGQAPRLTLGRQPTHLGRDYHLNLTVSDQGAGLQSLSVQLIQGSRVKTVWHRTFPAPPQGRPSAAPTAVEVSINPRQLGLEDGPATLVIEARDHSWRQWWHGNLTRRECKVIIDTIPPNLRLLSRGLYINRGGSAMVVYETDPEVKDHGVQVGQRRYQGYGPWPRKPNLRVCFFAYSQGQKRGVPIRLWVRDPGGNRTEMKLPVGVRWKRFRHATLNISDRFLQEILPRFRSVLPTDRTKPIDLFVWINTELRRRNNQQIGKAVSSPAGAMLFSGVFSRPQGKTMAGFPDRRRYLYHGKPISRATHLGTDVADVTNAPIRATAAGRVVHAGPLGIYGNTVILDHGLGVASLYGHLSVVEVKTGQTVTRNQRIGTSGATGLALGDHLHFSVLVGGVFVDPLEWWDPHWIRDNVMSRLREAGVATPAGDKAKGRSRDGG